MTIYRPVTKIISSLALMAALVLIVFPTQALAQRGPILNQLRDMVNPTSSPAPSPEPTSSATPEPSPVSSPSPIPTSSPQPSVEPSPSPDASPDSSPSPSPSPSAEPTPSPTVSPQPSPSPVAAGGTDDSNDPPSDDEVAEDEEEVLEDEEVVPHQEEVLPPEVEVYSLPEVINAPEPEIMDRVLEPLSIIVPANAMGFVPNSEYDYSTDVPPVVNTGLSVFGLSSILLAGALSKADIVTKLLPIWNSILSK